MKAAGASDREIANHTRHRDHKSLQSYDYGSDKRDMEIQDKMFGQKIATSNEESVDTSPPNDAVQSNSNSNRDTTQMQDDGHVYQNCTIHHHHYNISMPALPTSQPQNPMMAMNQVMSMFNPQMSMFNTNYPMANPMLFNMNPMANPNTQYSDGNSGMHIRDQMNPPTFSGLSQPTETWSQYSLPPPKKRRRID
eukprot:4492_1